MSKENKRLREILGYCIKAMEMARDSLKDDAPIAGIGRAFGLLDGNAKVARDELAKL